MAYSNINSEENHNILPLILCGGQGTRLWPLSRESFPKQYLKLLQDNEFTLLQKTLIRVSKINTLLSPIFIIYKFTKTKLK